MEEKKEINIEKKKSSKSRMSIRKIMIMISVVPVLILGIALTVLSSTSLKKNMTKEVADSLEIAAQSLYNTYSIVAPGDYVLEDGIVKKGERVITGDFSVVDALKQSYDMEITLFYGSERIATTLEDANGNRLIGTSADDNTVKWVLENGRKFFSTEIRIDGKSYFGFYVPILNSDKTVVGMAFAGRSKERVESSVRNAFASSLIFSVIIIFVALVICIVASNGIVQTLDAIMDYMGHVAKTDFSVKMPLKVKNRQDEIGDMGRYAVAVSQSLETMISTDPLTTLYNRRACSVYLEKWLGICNKAQENKISVAIGDIDFFKKINDNYGHECGDIVLKTVSAIFKENMKDIGFAARWGGEEFLLIFEMPMEQAKEKLQDIWELVRAEQFDYDGKQFKITMSAGINGNIIGNDFDTVVKEADACLYDAKETGRNRIITTEGEVIMPRTDTLFLVNDGK